MRRTRRAAGLRIVAFDGYLEARQSVERGPLAIAGSGALSAPSDPPCSQSLRAHHRPFFGLGKPNLIAPYPSQSQRTQSEGGEPEAVNRHHGVALMLAAALLTSCDTDRRGSEATSRTTVQSQGSPSEWMQLQRRRVELSQISASAPCPTSSSGQVAAAFAPGLGSGPLFPIGFDGTGRARWPPDRLEDGWGYFKILWVSDSEEPGPYLVRGRRLDAPGEVRFNESHDRELRLPAGGTATTPGTSWVQWPSHILVSAPGCYGLQIDSRGQSRPVVFEIAE